MRRCGPFTADVIPQVSHLDESLAADWENVIEWLRLARQQVRGEDTVFSACVKEFEHYLEHNELELALEALAGAAEGQDQSHRFWDSMCVAAMAMKLDVMQAFFAAKWAQTKGRGSSAL